MNNGNVNNNNKTNNNYVLAVRSGKWYHPFSFENLYKQYLKCRRHKRGTINALKFEINAEENLYDLCEQLQARTYKPTRSVCFYLEKPKMREIIASDFKDRIIHHVLIERLEAIYEPVFIHDSYACRRGKGTHRAVKRLQEFIRKGSDNGRRRLYYVHLDIKNFFISVNKQILFEILKKKLKDEDLLWLSSVIIFHDPTDACIIKGRRNLAERLPFHKSLFRAEKDVGIPVGNLTSQFFANLYLNGLDQFVKHVLKCRYYLRYCDDFIILHTSVRRLEEVTERIDEFVRSRLSLILHDKKRRPQPVSNGIDFLGYIIRGGYLLVRRRVVNNMKEKMESFKKNLVEEYDGVRTVRFDYDYLEKLRAVFASYMGHFRWADTHRLVNALLKRYAFVWEYFIFTGGMLKTLYGYRKIFPSVRIQYLYYAGIFNPAVIFFQVGCFYEFYDNLKDEVRKLLNLRRIQRGKRNIKYGFPVRLEYTYSGRLLNSGIAVVVVRQTERYIGRIRERLPVKIMKPL